jgi:hypothetical protein
VHLASAIRPCAGDHAEHRRSSNGPQGRGRRVFRVQEEPRAPPGALLRAREDRGRNENGRHVESPLHSHGRRCSKDAGRARTLRGRRESVDGHCAGHGEFIRLGNAQRRGRWLRARIVRRRKLQQFAHGDVPHFSSSFGYRRGDEVNRSIAGTTLLGNQSGSSCAVLALLFCLIDGGDRRGD